MTNEMKALLKRNAEHCTLLLAEIQNGLRRTADLPHPTPNDLAEPLEARDHLLRALHALGLHDPRPELYV